MAVCNCGTEAAAGDMYCQQCGQPLGAVAAPHAEVGSGPENTAGRDLRGARLGDPVSESAAKSAGWVSGIGARLDRFAAEGASGGLIRGALADAVAVCRQEPRRAVLAVGTVAAIGVVGYGLGTILTLVLSLGSLAALVSTSSGDGALSSEAATGGFVAFLFSTVLLPALIGAAVVVAMYVAAAARYLPLLGHLPAYRHRGLGALAGRWRKSVGPTIAAYLLVQVASLLCVLPGIYIGGRVAFTPHEAIAGGGEGRGALGRSWDRTTSSVWPVIGLVLLSVLLAAVPILAVWLLLLLLSAVTGDSSGGLAGVIAIVMIPITAVALVLPAALPPLPLAAAWLRLTSADLPGHRLATGPFSVAPTSPDMAMETRPSHRTGEVAPVGDPAPPAPDLPAASEPHPGGAPHFPTQHPLAPQVQADPAALQNTTGGDSSAAPPESQHRSAQAPQDGACRHCGEPLRPGRRFCIACGQRAATSNGTLPP